MNDGWIKIHRQILSWEWFDDPKMVQIFLYLILRANTEEKEWRGLAIGRGQFVTSAPKISVATGLTERQIRTCIKRLVESGNIIYDTTTGATRKCVIVTICNYDRYQDIELDERQDNDRETTGSRRRSDAIMTDKRQDCDRIATGKRQQLKNKKNNKNIIIDPSLRSGSTSDLQSNPEASRVEEKKFCDFFNSEMDAHGAIIPRIKSLGKTRRTHMEARCREHGKEALALMVRKAAPSNFLNGRNKRGWKATFDWLILPSNFQKVIEGVYDNNTDQPRIKTQSNENFRDNGFQRTGNNGKAFRGSVDFDCGLIKD